MPSKSRLSREGKGKDVVTSPSPASGSPLDEFDLIHRDALRDTENMSLSQRLLVADSHRKTRKEAAGRMEASGDSGTSGSRNSGKDQSDASIGSERSGSEASSRAPRPSRRVHRRVRFDQIDCCPTIYHPGGIFEELSQLPPDLQRDPRAQLWGNVFCSCSSHKTVKDLLRENGGACVTYIIPSTEQRPWSPPVGYQCVYESYFGDHTKLWFPIPRLVTSYTFHWDIAISHLLNGSLRITVMLMVMAAEIDISMSVRVFEELTFTKAESNGIFSVKMRANYNVLTGHPNKTQDWQRSYFYIKSDEHAFEEPPDDYRILWNKELVRHPNTIAYPEKFFESAQAIGTHSHLRWPDLSREWIRRQQARIARVDWESRLPCVLRPRKSRLSLFTRKQQKLLDEAREMDGVPDLSALLKGKLQLLSKKSTPANVPESTSSEGCGASEGGGASKERASSLVDEGFGAEPSASSPRKKKKSKKAKRKATDEAPLKKTASLDEASEDEAPAGGREGAAEDLVETDPAEAVPEDRPKKKTKKKFVDAEPRPYAVEATLVDVAMRGRVSPETPSEKKRKVSTRGSGSGSEPAASEKSAPDSSARKGSRSEGSLAKRGRIEFPERVQFSYDVKTPLIFNPLQCAELTRQIRAGTKELPQIEDLYFKDEYIDVAFARKRKLSQARLKAIERVRTEHKKANENAAKEKEVLRVKFEELEGKLKSDRASKKELTREKSRLEQPTAALEKEKAELLAERDAAVEKLI
ncbi:PREDICTED: uncharacterized protein At3g60930, chloroplastic-like [Brassica oleracea var. oleracea]|uniref:uncharacterized protein At3g60930, chloroplastic-like n=1 Tax=Brassica oleracea var. oleracea TaxID=109376 RepID=UPI0006A6C776|nr:PREDICTED: uncharacterized protein At3g60930, chloroplastic-like [Brassica oleracea var. oleracea]